MTDLIDKHYSYSVVAASLYSSKLAHSLNNLQDPTNNAFITNLLEAAKRSQTKHSVKKQPVIPDMQVSLCDKYSQSSDVLILRELCIIVFFKGRLNQQYSL